MPAIKAASYFRMSTDKQEDSIERQRSQVEPYARKQGYELVAEYVDEGIAGDEFTRRDGFQRLLRDAKAGKFSVIVCDELTRISRQEIVEFIAKVVHPLKEAAVTVDSAAEGPQGWDGVVEIIMLAVRQDKSAGESPRMARRVMASHLLLADKAGYTGGPPPYGYNLVPDPIRGKRLVIDPVRAEHVRLMFRMIDEGHTLGSVRAALEARGVPSPSGKKVWSRNGIYRVLRNQKYTGSGVWGVQANGKHCRQANGELRARQRGESRYAMNPPAAWVVRPDSHEAIIDRDQFERVQANLKGNQKRTTPHVNGTGFLLNKLLVCEHCGGHMLGSTWNGRRGYSCGGYLNYGKAYCHKNSIYEAPLVRVIVRKLQEAFLNPDNLQALRDTVRRQEEAEKDPAAVKRLEKNVARLDRDIAKANRGLLLVDDDLRADAMAELRSMKAERDRLGTEMERLKNTSRVEALEQTIAEAEAVLWRLQDALEQGDAELLRPVLRDLVSRVELRFTHWKTRCRTRSKLERGIIYVRLWEGLDLSHWTGSSSSNASVAQPVDAKLINCDLPPGSPLSKNVCTGRLRVSTTQAPSSRCV